ncbi:hypothetical protein [Halorubrum sp. Ea1]|uniref:hypothetical protein n=1 Tax=Halorubrum sp. Ea1 TaxID=1480718 RepID=UPI0011403BF5|nr:hypothetical protein [Halorubrum sp. Ea1]
MSRQNQKDLADEFFAKDDTESSVDFEIAFAALLATAVITYPISNAEWLGKLAAFSVLTITLVRRIAIASPYAPVKVIMKRTIWAIEFATTVCVIILLYSLSEYLSGIYGISEILVFSITSPTLLMVLVVFQEFIFRDYLIWWYAKFDEKQNQGDKFAGLWGDIKIIAYWGSRARKDRDSWKRISKYVDTSIPDLSEIDINKKKFFGKVLIVVVGAILIGVPSIILGISSGNNFVPFALPGIVFAHDHSCYQYVAYGSNSYEEFRKPVWKLSIWAVIYMLVFLTMTEQLPIV